MSGQTLYQIYNPISAGKDLAVLTAPLDPRCMYSFQRIIIGKDSHPTAPTLLAAVVAVYLEYAQLPQRRIAGYQEPSAIGTPYP